jgi:hypothetical protein
VTHNFEVEPRELKPGVILAAALDAMKIKAGERADDTILHPVAHALSLRGVAECFARRDFGSNANEHSLLMLGLSSVDFGNAAATALIGPALRGFEAQNEHRQFCHKLTLENFKPHQVAILDAGLGLKPIGEGERVQRTPLGQAAGEVVQLTSFAASCLLTRQAVVNDDLTQLANIMEGSGSEAARLEARLVAECLERNAVMTDGQACYLPENDLSGEVLSLASIGAALQKLRDQTLRDGKKANNKGRYLVVGSNLESTALTLNVSMGNPFVVVGLADLPPDRWFLLASPTASPTVALGRLKGSTTPIRVERQRMNFDLDGVELGFAADFTAAMLGRTGIVRGGTGNPEPAPEPAPE